MAGAMQRTRIPDGATCTSLGLPVVDDEGPTLACSGCIEYAGRCLGKRIPPTRSKKAKCQEPFLYINVREQTKKDTFAKINAFLSPADCDATAARNDTLKDGGGDPQKQAPSCREVSPDALGVIGQHLRSMDEESSSPAVAGMDDNEDGGAEEPYDIQDLADAVTLTPGGPTTPMRSPSPKKKRKYEIGYHREVAGDVPVNGIPNTYTLIRAQQLSLLFKESAELRSLKQAVTAGKFNWKDGARWFIACGISQIPRASFYAVEQFIPCIIAALFLQAGIGGICYEALANSMPSGATIGNIVFDGAAECLAIQRARLAKARAVMLGCDKGQRHGFDHLPKCLSYFDIEKDRVESFCLDNDPTGGTSDATASAVAHSLRTKVGEEVLKELRGQSTDSGGGGTLHSLKEGLELRGYVSMYLYFVLPCTIHAWQRALQNGMESVFGLGGLGTRNLLQLVHSCYDLQQCFPGDELRAMWTLAVGKEEGAEGDTEIGDDGDTPNRMSAAVLTRWWYVNTAVVHLLEHWDKWQEIAQKSLNSSKSSTKVGKIASSILSLMDEPKLRADAEFVKAVSLSLFNHHLLWLQGYDEIAKDTGYRCRSMGERYYLMMEDLDKLHEGGWRENPAFADFLEASAKLPQRPPEVDSENGEAVSEVPADGRRVIFYREDCGSSADNFFRLFRSTCIKHFDTWRAENPVFMFAGDQDCATALANWTVSGDLPAEDAVSRTSQETHGSNSEAINLRKYIAFVTEKTTRDELSATQLVKEHGDAVQLLANGESLWKSEKESVCKLAFWCKVNIIPLMSNTQEVEAQVREASLVATMGRDPNTRSAVALVRSTVDIAANRAAVEEQSEKYRRGNQHMSGGVQGERTLRSSLAKKKQGTNDADEGSSVADSRLVGKSPRGAIRSKNLLETIDSFNQELDVRPDRAAHRKTLAAIYKSKGDRYNDIRIKEKMEKIEATMNTQRLPNSMQRQEGVDVTALMEGKLMLHHLRSQPHKEHLVEELTIRGVAGVNTSMKWTELCKLMKDKEKNKMGWFTPMSNFFKTHREEILQLEH
jgi:hypothetical protein